MSCGTTEPEFAASFALSGPISKSARMADLNGLANKGTADFGLTYVHWEPRASAQGQETACAEFLVHEGKAKNLEDARTLLRKEKEKHPYTLLLLPAGSRFPTDFENAIDWGTPVLLTGRFKVGRESFKFARPPSYADEKAVHSSYSTTASLGVIMDPLGLVSGNYQYQSFYEGKHAANICSPLEQSTSLRCREIAVGAPGRTIRSLVQLELRRFFGTAFGINPRLSYDIRSDTWAARLPIYIFQNKDGGLNGGVALGWRSDTKSFTVSAFIGDVFTLLPR